MVQGDLDETFFLHGYDEERSKILYSNFKHQLANIFQGTPFKKHAQMLIEEKPTADWSKLFFSILSLRTARKKINKFFDNVHLHPIDSSYEEFSSYSAKGQTFHPHHLD